MERYVDMAYQRDDEEPRRWAFCALGETSDGGRELSVNTPSSQRTHISLQSPVPHTRTLGAIFVSSDSTDWWVRSSHEVLGK